jgi:predicted nucleic acid-binding protein
MLPDMRIYLDTCCLNRPFDDQSFDRNRLEAEAVLSVLRHVHQGEWQLVSSEVVELELSSVSSTEKREQVRGLLALSTESAEVTDESYARMSELVALGLKAIDALHIACAESAGCDVFLTTDDRLRKAARRSKSSLRVRVDNPLDWLREQFTNGDQ